MLETSREFWSMDSTWLTSLEASRYVVMNKLLLLSYCWIIQPHAAITQALRTFCLPVFHSIVPLGTEIMGILRKRSVQSQVVMVVTATAVCSSTSLTLQTLSSKFEFSFVASIHFLQKQWGEVDKISSKFILCDHVRNSHDHLVLQSIDIIGRNLMLITLRA